MKRLLFIGDSLIEFYDWQQRFPAYPVYNMGVAGETVEGLYSRLKMVYEQIEPPDMIFVMTGINNMAMSDRKFIPVYRKLVRSLKDRYRHSKVIVHSLLPVLFQWISNSDITKVNKELHQMAEEEGAIYSDIHTCFVDGEGNPVPEFLMEDGIHVSGSGYRIWSAEIEKLL